MLVDLSGRGGKSVSVVNIIQWTAEQRLRLAVTHFLGTIFPKYLVRQARLLAGDTVDEYAKVLSKPELTRFLDLREGEQPALPVDVDHFK